MFTAIAHFMARPRLSWLVIGIWLVLVVASRFAPAPKSSSQQQDFLPASDDSIVAAHIEQDPAKFPRGAGRQLPLTGIFHNNNGLTPDDIAKAAGVSATLNDPGKRPQEITGVSTIFSADNVQPGKPLPKDPRFLSSDGKTLTMTVLFDSGNTNNADNALATPIGTVVDLIKSQKAGDLQTGVAGPAVLIVDSQKVFKNLNGQLTLIAVLLIIVLLAIIYRAVPLILIPLVSILMADLVAGGVFGLIAHAFGIVTNQQSSSLSVVLILGAGTDYTLFIASRYREELRQNQSKYDAMWHTMSNIGEAIASSALIVVVTLVLLVFATLKFFADLGPAAALAIASMLVAGLTLVPAFLVLLGRYAFWPVMPRFGEEHKEESGIWARIAAIVANRPREVFAATGLLFVALALLTFGLKQRYDFVSNFPSNSNSRQGQALLEKAGKADVGKLSPTTVYITSQDNILNHLDQMAAISDAIAATNGIQSVTGFGGSSRPAAAQIQQQDAMLPPSQRLVSADGKTANITVYLNRDPYLTSAMDLITPIRTAARQPVKGTGLQVNVGGETAQNADTRSDVTRDLLLLGPLIFLAIGIILVALLRSLVAPLYLLVSTLLSYLATLGLTAFVFQQFFGSSGIQDFVPPFMAVFLIALGADYNVFIMSRVREEAHRTGIHAGTQRALARTGGVITSAGIILAGTFAVLITLPLQFLQQIGFSVAVGVLLDTFLVRVLLVPSIVFLLDRWNWWPSAASKPHALEPRREAIGAD